MELHAVFVGGELLDVGDHLPFLQALADGVYDAQAVTMIKPDTGERRLYQIKRYLDVCPNATAQEVERLGAGEMARITARPANFPVAVGGWNAIDALDSMPKDDAETLTNWFPTTTYLRLRGGYSLFCETGGEPATAMATYSSGTDDKVLAQSGGDWFDVTTGTASYLSTPGGGEIWSTTNFATAAGQYLIMVNGGSPAWVYNGTTMIAAVNTVGGAASTVAFSSVCSFNQRLYFAEADSMSIWYLDVGTYQGALTEFDLGPLATQGGKIAAIGTWTRDNAAAGANEMFVVVTDQGEVFIYQGLYPGGTWGLSARFVVGKPVSGPNCLTRVGPDLVLICEDGFQPLGQYLQLGQSQAQRVALSRKIGSAETAAEVSVMP